MANSLIKNGGASFVPPDLLNDSSILDLDSNYFDVVITDLIPDTSYALQFAWVFEDKTLSPYSSNYDLHTDAITIPEVSNIATEWTNSTFKLTFDRPEETVNGVVTGMANSFIITLTNNNVSHTWKPNATTTKTQTFILSGDEASSYWRNTDLSKKLPTSFTGNIKVVNLDGTSNGVTFTSNSATDPFSGRNISDEEWPVTSLFDGYLITLAQFTTSAEKEFFDYAELYEEYSGNWVLVDTGTTVLRHRYLADLGNKSIKIRYKSKSGVYSNYSNVKIIAAANPSGYDDTAPTNNITLGTAVTTEDPDGIFQFGYQTVFPWTVPSDIDTNVIYADQRGYKVRFRIKGSSDPYTYLTVPGKTSSSTKLNGLLAGATYEVGITTYDVYDNTDIANWKTYPDIIIPTNASFKENAKLTVGPMEFGYGVGSNSTHKGIYLAPENYWYITGSTKVSSAASFKVGGTNDYMFWDGTKLAITGSFESANGRIKGTLDIGDPTATTPIDGQLRVKQTDGATIIGKLDSSVVSQVTGYTGKTHGIFSYSTSTGNYSLIDAASGTFIGQGVILSSTGNTSNWTDNVLTMSGGLISADKVVELYSGGVIELNAWGTPASGFPVLIQGATQITENVKLDKQLRVVGLSWTPETATYSTYKVVGADENGNLNEWFGVLTSGAYGTTTPPTTIGNDGDFLFST